jgi:hypothetical protein
MDVDGECVDAGTPLAAHTPLEHLGAAADRSPLTPGGVMDLFSPVSVLIGQSGLRVAIPPQGAAARATRAGTPR